MSDIQVIKKFDFEKQVERDVAVFNWNDNVIEYIMKYSYFNATQMAKACGRDIDTWLKSSSFAEDVYLVALESGKIPEPHETRNGDTVSFSDDINFFTLNKVKQVKLVKDNNYWDLVKVRKGGNNQTLQGTFIHQDLAVQFAQWCNPLFRLQVSKWIKQLMSKGVVKLDDPDYIGYQQYKQLVSGIPSIETSEDDLSYRIQSWVNLCKDKGNFLNELVIKEKIDGESYLRRIDFVNKNPRNVVIYELKRHKITVDNIIDTIHDKKYLKLCRQYFKKPVKLVFLSPLGIAPKALTLIDEVINFDYKSTQQFCEEAYDYGVRNRWQHNIIELRRRCFSDLYRPLFSDFFLHRIGNPDKSIRNQNSLVNKIPC